MPETASAEQKPNLSVDTKNKKRRNFCDFLAFWIFGLSNNFAYICMLSAAQDIMSKHEEQSNVNGTACPPTLDRQHDICSGMALGPVLLANVVPLFFVKIFWPFIMHRISYGFQHTFGVILQVTSYLVVAFSDNIVTSLIGVVFASLGFGIGEAGYLALASHYSKHTISLWSSGTGAAGLGAALAYAALTEPHFLDLSPQTALLTMILIPAICFVMYFILLTPAPTIHPVMKLTRPSTWLVLGKHPEQPLASICQKGRSTDTSCDEPCHEDRYRELRTTSADVFITVESGKPKSFKDRCLLMLPTMKFMVPLGVTYFAQYLISQGLSEFSVFDCDRGFGLDVKSQYRWYQVLSQLGIFITRSSVSFCQLPAVLLFSLPFLQSLNAAAFLYNAYVQYIPHLWISFVMMLVQGLIAGASYVNTLFRIHKTVHPDVKEFSLAITGAWSAAGIAGAGIASIPLHAYFCARYAS